MQVKVYFNSIKKELIHNIKKANKEIKVAVAWMTDEDIIRELAKANKRKVNVYVAISNSKENFINLSNLKALIKSGGKLFVSNKNFLHHKFCIIDNETIINGSYNWTYSASRNEENIVIIRLDKELKLDMDFLLKFNSKFDYLCNKCCLKIDDFNMLNNFNIIINGRVSLTTIDEDEIHLRKDFEDEVKKSMQASKDRGIYFNSSYLLGKMESDGGGVEFVKRILLDEISSGELKSGFLKLTEAIPHAVDLSLEYIVAKEKYQSLFDENEILFCKNLMKKYTL